MTTTHGYYPGSRLLPDLIECHLAILTTLHSVLPWQPTSPISMYRHIESCLRYRLWPPRDTVLGGLTLHRDWKPYCHTYDSTQCPAVTIHISDINVPPHRKLSPLFIATTQGYCPGYDVWPPKIYAVIRFGLRLPQSVMDIEFP